MEAIFEWERRHIIVALQKLRGVPGVSTAMSTLGHIGTGEVLVTFFALLYWCLDQDLCVTGIWLVPAAEISNGILKWLFQQPRPGWVDAKIALLSTSHEYSFPSSHAMITGSLASFFMAVRPRLRAWPAIICTLVCVSRVYDGVHYPHDVVAGGLLGGLLGGLHAASYERCLAQLDHLGVAPGARVLLGLALTYVVWRLVNRYYALALAVTIPKAWNKRNGMPEGTKLEPFHVPYANYVAMCVGVGACIGLWPCIGVAPL
jgi:hypothetical protein